MTFKDLWNEFKPALMRGEVARWLGFLGVVVPGLLFIWIVGSCVCRNIERDRRYKAEEAKEAKLEKELEEARARGNTTVVTPVQLSDDINLSECYWDVKIYNGGSLIDTLTHVRRDGDYTFPIAYVDMITKKYIMIAGDAAIVAKQREVAQ